MPERRPHQADKYRSQSNREASSIRKEHPSTNEALLTSKKELQSLNETVTALNGQLRDALEQQRTTYSDLHNFLDSTNVATLLLDKDLNVRFVTPAAKLLFSVIPDDLDRTLAGLRPFAKDSELLPDARKVLQTRELLEREIEACSDVWFIRRILPYRTHDNEVDGLVITFIDITGQKLAENALAAAAQEAQRANDVKARFLADVSHDLRQPMQTLRLLHGRLSKLADGEAAQTIIERLDLTLAAMSGMLNTLLDIDRIAAGTVHAEIVSFPINDLLVRLTDEFRVHAKAQGLTFRFVPCHLSIRSDPRLLDEILRNLLWNALKYTPRGKVLLGCRRREGMLSIEIWGTGIGIPHAEIDAIFNEYDQFDNAALERGRGRGLGLSIAQSLAGLLDHRIHVRSHPGKGSVFAIEVGKPAAEATIMDAIRQPADKACAPQQARRTGTILVIEDEPDLRDLLELIFTDDGHRVAVAPDGVTAIERVIRDRLQPDLVLADYNLADGINGLQTAVKLRAVLHRQCPVVILTGDISTETLRAITSEHCTQLDKPVQMEKLTQTVQRLLASSPPSSTVAAAHRVELAQDSGEQAPAVIFVVDDDGPVREAIRAILEEDGLAVETFATCEAFLKARYEGREGCLLIDAYLPGMSGLDLLDRLQEAREPLPAIMITGHSDVSMVVRAMKAGAADFIEKPVGRIELLDSIRRALELSRDANKLFVWREAAARHIATLTQRQRQIMEQVLIGQPSKIIAAELGISQRTVENHRAAIMKKTGSRSLPALARLALAAASPDAQAPSSAGEDFPVTPVARKSR